MGPRQYQCGVHFAHDIHTMLRFMFLHFLNRVNIAAERLLRFLQFQCGVPFAHDIHKAPITRVFICIVYRNDIVMGALQGAQKQGGNDRGWRLSMRSTGR